MAGTEKKEMENEQKKPQEGLTQISQSTDYHAQYLEAKKDADEYLTRLKYMQADFENFKKRAAKEKIETIRFANEMLISDMLTILDALYSGLEKMQEGEEKKGMAMVLQNFSRILAENGLLEISAKEGFEFDPNFHECVVEENGKDPKLAGKIAKIIQKGYLLNGQVLRFAKVAVYAKQLEK